MRDLASQLGAAIVRSFLKESGSTIARILFHINAQEKDKYFENMLELKSMNKSNFAEEEKWIDHVGNKLENLASSIQQDILRSRDARKRDSKGQGPPIMVMLYLPEGRSYNQTVSYLCRNKFLRESVKFVYFGKMSLPTSYKHLIGESGDGGEKAIKPIANLGTKSVVVESDPGKTRGQHAAVGLFARRHRRDLRASVGCRPRIQRPRPADSLQIKAAVSVRNQTASHFQSSQKTENQVYRQRRYQQAR